MSDTIKMKRPPMPWDDDVSGCVKRDERGNAVWEWADDESRNQRLFHPGLEIADEEPLPAAHVTINKIAAKAGYDPYHSGMIDRDAVQKPRRRDLRALSQWIELKKKVGDRSGE